MVSYEKQVRGSWLYYLIDGDWLTAHAIGRRYKVKQEKVIRSIESGRPADVPCSYLFVVGGEHDGKWMPRSKLMEWLGCGDDSIRRRTFGHEFHYRPIKRHG